MDKKIFNLISWLEGGRAPPYILEIRLTNTCNLKCLSCWHSIHKRHRGKWDYSVEVSSDKLIKVVEDAGKFGVRRIEVTGGGEPLIKHDAFSKITGHVNRFGMEGSLTTNGTLFTEGLIKKIVKLGWDEILLSLDGPDAETHDYLRQTKGCFDKIIKNVRLFNKWKNKLKGSKPEIKFVPVLSNVNFDKLPKFIELAAELGVHEARFQPLYVLNGKQNFLRLTNEQWKKLETIIPETMDIAKKCNINTNADIFLRQKFEGGKEGSINIYKGEISLLEGNNFLSSPCFFPWFYMGVRPNGAITPCTAFNEFKEVNNINKSTDLLTIWHGKNFSNFRNNLLKRNFHSCCKNCCGGLIINNGDIRRQLQSYVKLKHINFSDIDAFLTDKKRITQELDEIQNSLSFKVGSKISETTIGKFLKKHLANKWTKK